jgi:ribonuclease E
VTSLGLVQMTRKRVGAGLLEAFSTQCECCSGRGVILTLEVAPETAHRSSAGATRRPIPAPPIREADSNGHSPGNGTANGNGRSRGNGSDSRPGNGRAGNRRSGGRSDNDWQTPAETVVADATLDDAALVATELDEPALESARLDSGALDSNALNSGALNSGALDSSALDSAALDSKALNGDAAPSARSGGRRTRRPTNGGTAFAAAVVEDSAPVQVTTVPAVTTASQTQPEPTGFTPVVVGDQAAPEDSGPPVRRTRAGSAVARVTVVSEPASEPETVPAPDLPVAVAVTETPAEPEAPAATPYALPESAVPESAVPESAVPEPEIASVAPEAVSETAAVVPEASPESVTSAVEPEPEPEPETGPAEPEAIFTKFVTPEPEPGESVHLVSVTEPADPPVTAEDAPPPVTAEDAVPSAASETPVAPSESEPEPEPQQAAAEEHPEG